MTRAFGFAIGKTGATALGDMHDAAKNAALYITRHGEDYGMGMVLFLLRVGDILPFFWDNFSLRFFGCDDDCAAAVGGVIAVNIPLQSL